MARKYLAKILNNTLTKLCPEHYDQFYVKSYSQEGEDMILRRVFEKLPNGFYVDVGAHHPMLYSNTYYFYKQGWSGINIDAMPGSMEQFNRIRQRDINIEAAIYKDTRELTYFMFNEPALNTFDPKLANDRISEVYHIIKKEQITTETLKEILVKYIPNKRKINFISIDVEGTELEVLQSNDWELFRPEYLLIEYCCEKINDIFDSELNRFLEQQKYDLFAKTVLTLIYKDRRLN